MKNQCLVCQKKIIKNQKKYCSHQCAGIVQSERIKQVAFNRRRRVVCVCQMCKRKFEEIPSRIKSGRGRFCSRSCFYQTRIGKIFNPNPTYGHKGKHHTKVVREKLRVSSKKQWANFDYREKMKPFLDANHEKMKQKWVDKEFKEKTLKKY